MGKFLFWANVAGAVANFLFFIAGLAGGEFYPLNLLVGIANGFVASMLVDEVRK